MNPVVRCCVCLDLCSGEDAGRHKNILGHNEWELLLPERGARVCWFKKKAPKLVATIPDAIPWKPTTEYQFNSEQVFQIVNDVGVRDHIYTWDSTYWAISLEDWKQVFADVLRNMPPSIPERFDCDKYAMLCATRIYERYQLNTCAVVEGAYPAGEHAFNLFLVWDGVTLAPHIIEPQTGEIDPLGYTMNIVIFG